MHFSDDIRAIPLWINGRATLKLTPDFVDVCEPASGVVLRRVPVCGAGELEEAIFSAQSAFPAWHSTSESRRRKLLSSLGDALEELVDHFARLVAEETGVSVEQAVSVVEKIVMSLRSPEPIDVAGLVVVTGDSASDLEKLASLAAAALAVGANVIICPPLQAPSALLALAELSGRCGFPAGTVSVVYPDRCVLVELNGGFGLTMLSC